MTTIKLKNGSGAPTAGDLAQGEPALDLTNKRLYTEDSGGTVIEVGTNPGTDVTFADNRKAIFGAGSDLQIYHSGSASFISDQGTGNLKVLAQDFAVNNPADTANMITAAVGGAVTAFYNGNVKLATTTTGIDVTGSVVSDGLTVSPSGTQQVLATLRANSGAGGGLVVQTDASDDGLIRGYDSSGNVQLQFDTDGGDNYIAQGNVGIGTSSPSTALDVVGTVTADGLTVDSSSGITVNGPTNQDGKLNLVAYAGVQNAEARIQSVRGNTSGTDSRLQFLTNNGTSLLTRVDINDNGDISFYEDTGTTASLVYTAASTSLKLTGREASRSNNTYALEVDNSAQGSNMSAAGAFNVKGYYGNQLTVNGLGDVSFYDDSGTAKLFWDASAESLGIGTSSPQNLLHVNKSDSLASAAQFTNSTTGTTSTDGIFLGLGSGEQGYFWNYEANDLIFGTSNAERMRIDSSGNLLVATTDTLIQTATSGGGLCYAADSSLRIARESNGTGQPILDLNNTGSDDELIRLRKDGTTVGSIASRAGVVTTIVLNPASGNGAGLSGGTKAVVPADEAGIIDNDISLGVSTHRFKDLYLSSSIKLSNSSYDTGSTVTTSVSGDLITGLADTALRFYDAGDAIIPRSTADAARDGTTDLGASNSRFKDLYLSGGVYLGGTGSANKLDDYEEGTFTPTLIGTTSGSATVTVTSANYTKVGNVVHVYGHISVDLSSHNIVGAVEIGGMPFNASTVDNGGGTAGYNAVVGDSVFFRSIGTRLRLTKGTTPSWQHTELQSGASSLFMFQATYRTA